VPSYVHELLVQLVRERIELLLWMLRHVAGLPIPEGATCRVVSPDLSAPQPVELRADLVVEICKDGRPVLVVIIEVQLQRDDRKWWTWPQYLTTARAESQCDALVLVVCADRAVARWAAEAIPLGPGSMMRPAVVGPDAVPIVTDPEQAASQIGLAVLSAVAHENEEGGARLFATVVGALQDPRLGIDEEHRRAYTALMVAALSEATQREVETMMERGEIPYLNDFTRRFYEEGRAEGRRDTLRRLREALVRTIAERGWSLDASARARIAQCDDPDRLVRWAARIGRADDLATALMDDA